MEKLIAYQARSETPSNQAFEGVKLLQWKLFWYFWYKFFDVKFFILENAILQMPLSLIYQTHASFFWSTKYTQQIINTLGAYAVVNDATLRPKEMAWLVLFEGFERVKPCKFAVVASIGQKTKTKKADGGTKFSGVRWLGEE